MARRKKELKMSKEGKPDTAYKKLPFPKQVRHLIKYHAESASKTQDAGHFYTGVFKVAFDNDLDKLRRAMTIFRNQEPAKRRRRKKEPAPARRRRTPKAAETATPRRRRRAK